MSTKPKSKIKSTTARAMQAASMAARVSRHFDVEFELEPGAVMPWRKRETDAGFDICASENALIDPYKMALVPTGIRVCSPPGYWYDIRGRSSVNNWGILIPSNAIDATYTGLIQVPFFNITKEAVFIRQGDKIAQIVFFPILHPRFVPVEKFTLGVDARGHNGFGSSGR